MTETISFAKTKLTLGAKVLDKMPMTLYSQVGEGKDGDRKVTVNMPVTQNCIYVVLQGGQTYQVNFIDVVQACLKAEKSAANKLERQSKAIARLGRDADSIQMAEKLKAYVVQKYPHYESTVNVTAWANSFYLLSRQDKRFTYDLQAKVMKWLFEQYQPRGDFDWREQVRSGVKFRKHFPALLDLIRKEIGDAQVETI